MSVASSMSAQPQSSQALRVSPSAKYEQTAAKTPSSDSRMAAWLGGEKFWPSAMSVKPRPSTTARKSIQGAMSSRCCRNHSCGSVQTAATDESAATTDSCTHIMCMLCEG